MKIYLFSWLSTCCFDWLGPWLLELYPCYSKLYPWKDLFLCEGIKNWSVDFIWVQGYKIKISALIVYNKHTISLWHAFLTQWKMEEDWNLNFQLIYVIFLLSNLFDEKFDFRIPKFKSPHFFYKSSFYLLSLIE